MLDIDAHADLRLLVVGRQDEDDTIATHTPKLRICMHVWDGAIRSQALLSCLVLVALSALSTLAELSSRTVVAAHAMRHEDKLLEPSVLRGYRWRGWLNCIRVFEVIVQRIK